MKYSLYAKPYKTPLELITKMKSQNLLVLDTTYAQLVLSGINYFRFKIYLRPFLDVSTKTYKQHLSNLKKEGKIKRIGSAKSGYWEVNND